MRDIVFEQTDDRKQFTFKDDTGADYCFEYRPSIEGLWKDIDLADFDVQLLIHPFLNKESNVFSLQSNLKTKEETVGFVFPISVLDSDSFEAKRSSDNNYLFAAYQVLLTRLSSVKDIDALSPSFEDNVCVCVLNLRTIGKDRGVWNCIHSLRKFGYAYFVEHNQYKEIEGYTLKNYKALLPGSRMHVDFSIPSIYSDPIIDGLLRSLPKADNLVYRFILLYQIVEFLISKRVSASIHDAIKEYQKTSSCSENDFLENINHIRKERGVISEILESCGVTQSTDCIKDFNKYCQHLYDLAGITPQKKDEGNLFYSFRNQMVHSFRHLSSFHEELADTVFYFEQVVLTIVARYPFVMA